MSVDFNLSFWGDAERMLGFFHLAHFLVFYLVIITAFRSWKDWQNFFGFSIAIAVLVSLTGLLGKNPYGTIGNTAYVSGYLIFNLYFVILLFFRSNNKKSRWFLLLPFLIMLFEFWKMKTSGAIIGLGASFLLLFLLLGLTHVNKKIRRLSLFLFLGAGIALIFIFSQSQSAWFHLDGDSLPEIILYSDHERAGEYVNRGNALWALNPDLTRAAGFEPPSARADLCTRATRTTSCGCPGSGLAAGGRPAEDRGTVL